MFFSLLVHQVCPAGVVENISSQITSNIHQLEKKGFLLLLLLQPPCAVVCMSPSSFPVGDVNGQT
jgi:hypothetical protein